MVAAAAVTSDAASLVSFLRTNASIARSIGPLLPNMTRRAASTTKHRFARSAEESTECEIQSEIEAELTMNGWWSEVKGKRTNKLKKYTDNDADFTPPNNQFTAFATFTPEVPIIELKLLAMKRKLCKKPTQKHVKHTHRLLAQQESAFLD